ncbi:hypothetical protein [Micromonospora sp. NPDC049679]|uniref:SCO6745 family protein n=1 Tax=Micromonospora sp. NPDC049679 TaxID=3155920 RepID=UPI0033D727C4
MGGDPRELTRTMWTLFEPVHAVTYFAPQARAAFEAAGLRGFWRGYFAGRAAPFGAVGAGPVYATFFGFSDAMVRRALPDVWTRADPAAALTARCEGARQALSAVLGDVPPEAVVETATLLRTAASTVDVAGRALAAANADLPWPEDALDVLWQAATVLREHRGDGHVAALLVAGLDGIETQVWRAALDGTREVLQPARGWSDEEWAAAAARLTARGWLRPDGVAADAAYAARDEIEHTTDALASAPWRWLGTERTARLAALLTPIAAAARAYLPDKTPIGLPPSPTADN